ncbi:hypothetical protein MO867_17505 [Microbulbifer sp. OS29]|uniref:Uncharacterized protein n=1 Tax=Microbulbifer okhotskensis TaxID=2926617 RepID=A0A9X2EQS4_9GAMM|nr:hypothetical protein [Microbulbifer okhotskensis]MCO1336131.1 hypothetical protein [Microbulbifer okhotskensis]
MNAPPKDQYSTLRKMSAEGGDERNLANFSISLGQRLKVISLVITIAIYKLTILPYKKISEKIYFQNWTS